MARRAFFAGIPGGRSSTADQAPRASSIGICTTRNVSSAPITLAARKVASSIGADMASPSPSERHSSDQSRSSVMGWRPANAPPLKAASTPADAPRTPAVTYPAVMAAAGGP